MNRKILVITVLYIIGTVGGLYFYKNIIPLFFIFFVFLVFFVSDKKSKIIYILIIMLAYIRAGITNEYVKGVEKLENISITGDIIRVVEKSGNYVIDIQAKTINDTSTKADTIVRAYLKKYDNNTKVGNRVFVNGTKYEVQYVKNSGGFDYKMHMKSKKIFCIIEIDNIKSSKSSFYNYILANLDFVRLKVKNQIKKFLPERNAGICTALVVGEKDGIEEDDAQNFSEAGLSHIIAISGMHTIYVSSIALVFKKIIGRRKSYILAIVLLIIFCNIAYNTESVFRATIMLVVYFFSKIFFRKSDSISSLFLSILICLIRNPFSLYNSSLILSCTGTLGVITMYEEYREKSHKIKAYLINQIKLGFAANLVLFPIVAKMYNQVSLKFIISSPMVNFIIGIIMPVLLIYSFGSIFDAVIPVSIIRLFALILELLSNILLDFAEFFGSIKMLNINIGMPSLLTIVVYYIVLYLAFKYKKTRNRAVRKSAVNLISIYLVISLIFYGCSSIFTNNLKIYFVDVGQGDCTFIVTPKYHTILIDGGGKDGESHSNSVGNKIVVPYLRNKKVTKIDYIFISHFDSDHVGGVLTVMEELGVRNVVITKQGQESANYQKFCDIVNNKHINVFIVEKGNKVVIEENLCFDIIWPDKELVGENILNNNSMVCKLNYNKFSMLFTGDIEAISEKKIVTTYEDNKNVLKSTCLKAGHHGSKTSSIKEFVDIVNPEYVLVGVGIGNKFGHPNASVIEYFYRKGVQLFRTDQDGEITIDVSKNGDVKIRKHSK